MTALVDTAQGGFMDEKGGGWKPIKSAPRDGTIIDLWLVVHASPMSFGMSDEFGVPDAWLADGKWVHTYHGKPAELNGSYIKKWRPKTR